jgi:putative sigma-54 modulation protein
VHINISARHGHLSAGTQQKIEEKVDKLQRYFDRLTAIQVTVNLEHRDSPTVEVRVSAEHTDTFVADATASDVMTALDGTLHKIEQQIRRYKDKRTERRTKALKHLEVPAEGELESE